MKDTKTYPPEFIQRIEKMESALKVIAVWADTSAKIHLEETILRMALRDIAKKATEALE
jgi:hypothetical protein